MAGRVRNDTWMWRANGSTVRQGCTVGEVSRKLFQESLLQPRPLFFCDAQYRSMTFLKLIK